VAQEQRRSVPALPAAVVETHISTLFFVDDRVYKRKRSIRLPFVDLTDRVERERLCHREVELNRRLAPDVYLGVADITGPDGELCDHLVVMQRLPVERRLSTLVSEDAPELPGAIDDLAGLLARFHATAERSPAIAAAGAVDAVRARWADLVAEIRATGPDQVDPTVLAEVEGRVGDVCDGRRVLFDERVASGCICDGHGDLQADDVFCLDDGPQVLDCVEFDDHLRHVDVADDVAFLAMDLERLGRRDLSDRFVRAYEHTSGTTLPPTLVAFYVAYRALVRCMVACTRAAQLGERATGAASADPERPVDAARAQARLLLDLARDALARALPSLVIVGGLPGTGKTTLARDLSTRLPGSTVVSSDEVRKELAGVAPTTRAPGAEGAATFETGLYRPEATDRVYRELTDRAAAALAAGRPAIVDASFRSAAHRALFADVAANAHAPLVQLCCVADRSVADDRIRRRLAAGHDASDATPAVAARMSDTFDPWPDATAVDTGRQRELAVQVAAEVVAGTTTCS
jgi:aminoglycoside phosphotransferase family enzyme/predicted kinase